MAEVLTSISLREEKKNGNVSQVSVCIFPSDLKEKYAWLSQREEGETRRRYKRRQNGGRRRRRQGRARPKRQKLKQSKTSDNEAQQRRAREQNLKRTRLEKTKQQWETYKRKWKREKTRNHSRDPIELLCTVWTGRASRGQRRMACQAFSADSFTTLAADSPLPILMHHASTSDCLPASSHAHSMVSAGKKGLCFCCVSLLAPSLLNNLSLSNLSVQVRSVSHFGIVKLEEKRVLSQFLFWQIADKRTLAEICWWTRYSL